jgi:hypothetical protein
MTFGERFGAVNTRSIAGEEREGTYILKDRVSAFAGVRVSERISGK